MTFQEFANKYDNFKQEFIIETLNKIVEILNYEEYPEISYSLQEHIEDIQNGTASEYIRRDIFNEIIDIEMDDGFGTEGMRL